MKIDCKNNLFFACPLQMPHSSSGFTLVELIMVMAIIGVLASMAFFGFNELKSQVRISRCCAEIRGLEKDIISFATEKGVYPDSLSDAGMLQLKDPWGNLYEYKPPNTRQFIGQPVNTDFDLFSRGPDKLPFAASIEANESRDDIIRCNDGAYVGVATSCGI